MSDLKAALEAWGSDQQPQKRKRGGKKQRERAEEHAKRQKEAPVAAAPVAAAAPAVAPVAAAPVVAAPAPAAGQDLKSALEAWGGDQEPAKRKRGGKKQRERAEEHAKQAAAAAPTAAAAPVAAPTAAAPTAAAPVAAPATATKSARVCEHFARGQCTRGDKCRFSHAAGASSEGTKKRARPGAQARHKAQDWAANNGKREPDRGDNVRDVECRGHALPCVRRVVEKAGAKNYGRAFLSCRYWRDKGGCGHFAWVDDGGTSVR